MKTRQEPPARSQGNFGQQCLKWMRVASGKAALMVDAISAYLFNGTRSKTAPITIAPTPAQAGILTVSLSFT